MWHMAVKDMSGKKINLSGKRNYNIRIKDMGEPEPAITNMMMDPRYLRQSSSLIQDGLQRGFDVLQLANGDIVMTGTKTVVYQYTWEESKGKLVKIKADKKIKREVADPMDIREMDDAEVESEAEDA
jgi:hypothetical protein